MIKLVRLYLTPEDIKEKLGSEYKNNAVLFTKAEIGNDNSLTFECLITDEEKMTRCERRERLVTPDDDKILLEKSKELSNICGMTLGESFDYLSNVVDAFRI